MSNDEMTNVHKKKTNIKSFFEKINRKNEYINLDSSLKYSLIVKTLFIIYNKITYVTK